MFTSIITPGMDAKDEHWKTLDSKYIFNGDWLTVREETVELPNGNRISPYYLLEYPHWVNVIAITAEGKFVLVRQYRQGLQTVNYELCAGVCEQDEEPLIAAKRELLEETGYGNGTWQLFMTVSPNASTQTNLTYCFLATGVELLSTQKLDEAEYLTVHLLESTAVFDLLRSNQIMQALMVAPLWKYFYDFQNEIK